MTERSHVKPLYLSEKQVAELLSPAAAVEAIEACFGRMARGAVENRAPLPAAARARSARGNGGVRPELGTRARRCVYSGMDEGARFVVLLLLSHRRPAGALLKRCIDADKLGRGSGTGERASAVAGEVPSRARRRRVSA